MPIIANWAKVVAGTWEHNLGLPKDGRDLALLSQACLSKKLNQELELSIELGHHNVGHRHFN